MNPSVDKLSEDLGAWAEKSGCSSDPFVVGFQEAVRTRDQMGAWAAMDAFESLPTAAPRSGRIFSAVAEVIFLLRNLGVFAPVALTWGAIAAAAEGFGKYTNSLQAQNPNLQVEVNFFRFWQESSEWWRLSHVAILDVIIISAVIGLTLVGYALRAISDRQQRAAVQMAEEERRALAIQMKVVLHGRRNATVESVTESLADSLSDLTQAARDLGTVASRFEEASVGVSSLSPQVEKLNGLMAELLARGVTDVSVAMSTLVSSVNSLDGAVAGGLRETLETAVLGINEINGQIQATGISVEFGTKQLRDDLDFIHDRLISIATLIDDPTRSRGAK